MDPPRSSELTQTCETKKQSNDLSENPQTLDDQQRLPDQAKPTHQNILTCPRIANLCSHLFSFCLYTIDYLVLSALRKLSVGSKPFQSSRVRRRNKKGEDRYKNRKKVMMLRMLARTCPNRPQAPNSNACALTLNRHNRFSSLPTLHLCSTHSSTCQTNDNTREKEANLSNTKLASFLKDDSVARRIIFDKTGCPPSVFKELFTAHSSIVFLNSEKSWIIKIVQHKNEHYSEHLWRNEFIMTTLVREINHASLLSDYQSYTNSSKGIYLHITPYCGVDTLELLNSEELLDLSFVSSYIEQVSDAIAEMHKHGLVHYDIKPENVVYKQGYWTLLDYGLSRNIYHRPPHGLIGTFPYILPYFGLRGLSKKENHAASLTFEELNRLVDIYAFALSILNLYGVYYRYSCSECYMHLRGCKKCGRDGKFIALNISKIYELLAHAEDAALPFDKKKYKSDSSTEASLKQKASFKIKIAAQIVLSQIDASRSVLLWNSKDHTCDYYGVNKLYSKQNKIEHQRGASIEQLWQSLHC